MSDAQGTIGSVFDFLAVVLMRLARQLTPTSAPTFFAELGIPLSPANATTLAGPLNAVTNALTQVGAIRTDLEAAVNSGDVATVLSKTASALSALAAVIKAFPQLSQAIGSLNLSGVTQQTIDALPDQILNWLIVDYLSGTYALNEVLEFTGILERTDFNVNSTDPNKPFYTINTFQFDKLSGWLTSPADQLKTLYDWGTPAFDGKKLLPVLDQLAAQLGLPVLFDQSGPSPVLDLVDVTLSPSAAPAGLSIVVNTNLGNGSVQLAEPDWTLTFASQAGIEAGTKFLIRSNGAISATAPDALNSSGPISVAFTRQPASGPIVIVGIPGGSVLQAQQATASAGVQLTWSGTSADADLSLGGQVSGGKLVIDMSEADGFLSDVAGGTPIQATFDLAATWAPSAGLHVTGGGQLEIDLPLHLDLGPVTLDTIYVIGGISGGDLTLELSAALGVTLGPIQASVDRVGLLGTLSFPQGGGNLGPADLALAFKPPNGLGLEIDAGPASGGGYIFFDPSKGQYAGVLDVSLMDVVQVKVIGVIDTIMPDGSSGFSFILIITFDLPPIQLGFGFTLNGVGGLGGVNRTIDTTALQAGFVAHSLDSILFPPDPVANAAEIISNIRNFFPVAENSYVFGPMMEIGWGTPTLITIEIGVILELPQPVVIVLLGLVDVALPTSDVALIQLHIDVLGELDFGTKTLEIEGDMYDSSVLIYSMSGSLFFRICWGSDPNFIYSVGGFNPHFNTAGLDVPQLQRCSVSIGDGDNPRISANNYFAVTSNSLQFGANVQAYASAAGFTVQGYLGFDVLIIFSPFSFEFDFSVSFSASFEGINLLSLSVSGALSGPRPWNFNGSASIGILFWTVSVSLNLTWGDSTPVTIPQKPVLPDLANALQTQSNWSAALPAGMTPAASLAAPNPSSPTVVVYPMGTLSVRENVVPLDVTISRYGNATPSDGSLFAISDVQINNQETTRQTFQEYFAPGQFNALNDADKLSLPSFELYDAGVTIGSNAIDSGKDTARTIVYEERYIDSPMSYSRSTGPYLMAADISAALSRQGAGFVSPVMNSGLGKYSAGPATAAMTTSEESYVVANTNDLSVRSDVSSASGVTYFQARAALNSHLAANPADTGDLQIVTLYEAAA